VANDSTILVCKPIGEQVPGLFWTSFELHGNSGRLSDAKILTGVLAVTLVRDNFINGLRDIELLDVLQSHEPDVARCVFERLSVLHVNVSQTYSADFKSCGRCSNLFTTRWYNQHGRR
jgi:hypothetical protein